MTFDVQRLEFESMLQCIMQNTLFQPQMSLLILIHSELEAVLSKYLHTGPPEFELIWNKGLNQCN